MFLWIIPYYFCSEKIYVNVRRKPEINPNSLLKVVDSISYDDFANQYGGVRENKRTHLLVFKVKILEYLCTTYTFKDSEKA